MKPKKVIVLSIKPKYAKMIYEGTKAWEFRKKAPPVGVPMLIYESAPVSKVTGTISFAMEIRAIPKLLWLQVKGCWQPKTGTGISMAELDAYAGGQPVSALMVLKAERLDKPFSILNPPQNWGSYWMG